VAEIGVSEGERERER